MNAFLSATPEVVQARTLYLGIYREQAHWLSRTESVVNHDDLLMQHVRDLLKQRGHEVMLYRDVDLALRTGEKFLEKGEIDPRSMTIFNMCRDLENLSKLEHFEKKYRIRIINTPQSTKNLLRKQLYWEMDKLKIPMPWTQSMTLRSCEAHVERWTYPLWIKSATHHHVNGFGVHYVDSPEEMKRILNAFEAKREEFHANDEVILQQDIRGGREIKFYGVIRGEQWLFFKCQPELSELQSQVLKAMSLKLARHLGIEIFGGDAMEWNGQLLMVDFNSWPSFRVFREGGAQAIVQCLTTSDGSRRLQ